LIVATTTLSKD